MVIQRWQSVLLLIAGVMMGCFTFFSLGQVQLPDMSLNLTTLGFTIEGVPTDGAPGGYEERTWAFFVVSLMSFIIPVLNIFLFKNLSLQKNLCLIEALFITATIVIALVVGYNSFEGNPVSWSSLAIAPFIALVADTMALNCIRKDDHRLKSVDRFR